MARRRRSAPSNRCSRASTRCAACRNTTPMPETRPPTARERVLVALDVESLEASQALLDRLAGVVRGVKIGTQLFTSAGPAAVEAARKRDLRVFLDLKFHDIP